MDEKELKEHQPSSPRLSEAEEEGGMWVPVDATGTHGDDGVKRLTGLVGLTGLVALRGLAGLIGLTGLTGLIGLTGLMELMGLTELTGLI